jgi:virginiamycin B lyase
MVVPDRSTARRLNAARRFVAACLLAALAAGCSGGGSTRAPLPGALSQPQSTGTAPVTFTMHWSSAAGTSAAVRTPKYVGAAQSVGVTINGGTPQFLNAPVTTMVINAPVGTDTFAFTTYDEPNGNGNVVSTAAVTKQIVLGTSNTISAVLDAVVASFAITLSNATPNAGVPTTSQVNVNVFDVDGNLITGSTGIYANPITLSISDPSKSGQLTLSRTLITSRNTVASVYYAGGTLSSATIEGSAQGLPVASAAFSPTPTFYQFSIPTSTNRPQWIAAGPDGNMWFTESPTNLVARITPAGVVTEYTIPTASSNPQQIIAASDGRLWFTEFNTNKIAAVTTTGTFTEYTTLFAPPPDDNPFGLVDRGDGTIWYAANGSSRVGFQGSSSGTAGETSVPTSNSGPYGIATAPDNNLYLTESNADQIDRVTNLFTQQSEISLTAGSVPESIVRGPDGNLWFTENGTSKVGRLSPGSFSVTGEFPTLTPNAAPTGIVVGRDGALWFTENGLDRIGRITMGGTVSEYASPVGGLGLRGIAAAPDGSLWFCEPGTGQSPGRIGKLVY